MEKKANKITVLELPCYINDIVYVLVDGLSLPARRRVTEIHIDGPSGIVYTVRNDRTGEESWYFLWQFGDDIFSDFNQAKEAKEEGDRSMRQEIKEKDIRDFEEYARKLNEVIGRIQEYNPKAYIFATPGTLNLINSEDMFVTGVSVSALEAGDW